MRTRHLLSLAALLLLAGCRQSAPTTWEPRDPAPPPDPYECDTSGEAPRAQESLHWKRHAAIVNDIELGLGLSGDEVCQELGVASCRDAHLVPLGGNDPFGASQYLPVQQPLATTPIALDRLVLGSCVRRADLDRAAVGGGGAATVFTEIDLEAGSLDPASESTRNQVSALFRRLLGRDASETEISTVADLAGGDAPPSARDFAVAACFAVGTSAEMALF